jgi:hypothetical protein
LKKNFTIMAIKKMQIKTTKRCPPTPVRIPGIFYHQEHKLQQVLVSMLGKRNSHTLLVGMLASTSIMENSMEAHLKTKNRPAILTSIVRYIDGKGFLPFCRWPIQFREHFFCCAEAF